MAYYDDEGTVLSRIDTTGSGGAVCPDVFATAGTSIPPAKPYLDVLNITYNEDPVVRLS